MKAPKSLSRAECQRVRDVLRDLVAKFETQQAVARKLRVSQQTVSSAVNGHCGVALARKVAAMTGQSFDELVSGQPRRTALRDDARWAAAEDEARRRNRALPDEAFRAAGDMISATAVPNLDATFVAGLAKALWGASSGAPTAG